MNSKDVINEATLLMIVTIGLASVRQYAGAGKKKLLRGLWVASLIALGCSAAGYLLRLSEDFRLYSSIAAAALAIISVVAEPILAEKEDQVE